MDRAQGRVESTVACLPFLILLLCYFRFYFAENLNDRLLMECLSRLQNRVREFGVIGGIRKMLRLQAEAVATLVDVTFFPRNRAVKKISRVELHSRLRSRDFQHTPRWSAQ